MESFEKVLDILKWIGLTIILIIWLYFFLKKKGWWEPVEKKLSMVFGEPYLTDEEFLRAQEQSELRRKLLNELKDPCPYCKFNLKSGEDKCDECGTEFYKTAEEM